MSTCVFGTPVYSDSSVLYSPTLSGGSWVSTLPLTNLQDRRLGKVARSNSAAKDDTLFTVDLKTDRPVRLVGIPKHTMSSAGRWRVVGLPSTSLFNYEVGDNLTAKGATFSRGSTATYVDANGVVQTASSGTARDGHYINGVRHLLLEASRTNVVLWNRDLTNVAWTKTNTTAALTQTGADGVANSASLLTATAGNGTCLQSIVLASSARYQTAYVKRVTGTGTVQMTMDNGATWTTITVTSSWSRVSIATQTLANPTVGFRLVTSGDAIAVDFVQNEDGTVPTTPIATTTATVTRSADVLYFTYTPVPQAMTVYAKFTELGIIATSGNPILLGIYGASAAAPEFAIYNPSGKYTSLHWNAATVTSAAAAAPSVGDTVEIRATLGSDGVTTIAQSINSGTEAVATPSSATALAGAWAAQRLYLNSQGTGNVGVVAFRSIRIATGSSNSLTTMQGLVYDSGWLTPWPGSLTAEDLAKPDGTSLNVLAFTQVPSTATNARYWTIQFDDTANTAGYIDVARLCITGALTPSININDGDKAGYESDTIRAVTPGGTALYDVRASRRINQFTINNLQQAESLASIRQMERQLGLSGQFLWIPDPSDTTYGYERNFLAVMRELGALESNSTRYNTTFNVAEEL